MNHFNPFVNIIVLYNNYVNQNVNQNLNNIDYVNFGKKIFSLWSV